MHPDYMPGTPIKNNPLEKKKDMHFSNVRTDLSQTFRLCMRVFARHILQILLKQLIGLWFNRHSSFFQVNLQLCILI